MNIEKYIEEEFKNLHRKPELSHEEYETTRRIREILQEHDIKILDLPLKTGLVAEIGNGKPIIALRCDIDALPINEETNLPYKSESAGKMHACGHDFHTATILGTALLLNESVIDGTIRFIFQPAEESAEGAQIILDSGALKDVSLICGLHVTPNLKVDTLGLKEGAVTASVDRFKITFIGKGTHAAHPDCGIDPIVTAANFITAAQTIVSRNVNPASSNLLSITHITGGNTWNVIPDSVFLEGTVRSFSKSDRQFIKERIYTLAENIANAYGATANVEWIQGPPATDNNADWIKFAAKKAMDMQFNIVNQYESLAGEDFAFYQECMTGIFILVGTGESASNHNPKFQVDIKALYPAAKYFAQLALAALEEINSTYTK